MIGKIIHYVSRHNVLRVGSSIQVRSGIIVDWYGGHTITVIDDIGDAVKLRMHDYREKLDNYEGTWNIVTKNNVP